MDKSSSIKGQLIKVLAWLLLGGFVYLAGLDFYNGVIAIGGLPPLAARRSQAFLLGIVPVLVLLWLAGLWFNWSGKRLNYLDGLETLRGKLAAWVRYVLCALILAFPGYLLMFSRFGEYTLGYWFRLALLLLVGALGTWLVFGKQPVWEWLLHFSILVCVSGAIFAAFDWLSAATNYPFSQGWSEGNRMWDYSLMFGKGRYINPGNGPIFAFISTGRQFLWALAFLLPGLNIFGIRLWDAVLWILPGLVLGWASLTDLRAGVKFSWLWKAGFAMWVFIFLAQGPIYAPLVVSAILVVAAVRQKNLAFSVILVVISGYYAYISRWTWTYAPGLWAGILALLEISEPGFRSGKWKQLSRPVILGIAGYFGGQLLPKIIHLSQGASLSSINKGLIIDPTSAVVRQPLLWDRMLPNSTYAPGILLGTVWAGLPLVLLLIWLYWKRIWKPNILQVLAMAIPALAFLSVGLIASAKIGGGSNLHNIDMFWITLALIGAWAWKEVLPQFPSNGKLRNGLIFFLSLVLVLPAAYEVQYGSKLTFPPANVVESTLQGIQDTVSIDLKYGEVLFMDQRQLLTFGYIKNVPLVGDYEKKYMMDEALTGDSAYFQTFYRDLANKRFSLIVSEPLETFEQRTGEIFGDEGDDFVKWVSIPVLCYYQPIATFSEAGVQLLEPRPVPLNDPQHCPNIK
ncbi:MAG: hypothetical protein P4L50_17170 [Anaerolineaceae bacterium]|nr:hypothetical protein [Anaerolineaceae bacterium]